MKVRTAIVALVAALSSLALVAPAHAAGQVCYDVQANVNGGQVVSETGCVDLP